MDLRGTNFYGLTCDDRRWCLLAKCAILPTNHVSTFLLHQGRVLLVLSPKIKERFEVLVIFGYPLIDVTNTWRVLAPTVLQISQISCQFTILSFKETDLKSRLIILLFFKSYLFNIRSQTIIKVAHLLLFTLTSVTDCGGSWRSAIRRKSTSSNWWAFSQNFKDATITGGIETF